MEQLWIIPIALVVLLDIAALFAVINEDLLYEVHQKFFKVVFILLIPIIGAIVELYLLSRYVRCKDESGQGDDAKWYAFWDHYSSDHSSSGGHFSSDSGGSDGGGD